MQELSLEIKAEPTGALPIGRGNSSNDGEPGKPKPPLQRKPAKPKTKTQQDVQNFIGKLTSLKTSLTEMLFDTAEIMNSVATDRSWSLLNNTEALTDIRRCRQELEESKRSSPFWRMWSTPQWKDDIRKHYNDATILAEQDTCDKIGTQIKALIEENARLRRIHAADIAKNNPNVGVTATPKNKRRKKA